MRMIRATMQADGQVVVEGNGGYVQEHKAACLAVELNERFLAEDIDYHCFCFEFFEGGQKYVGNNIYGISQDAPAYRRGNKIYCPLPEKLTRAGRLTCQVEAHKTLGTELVRLEKSGLFVLEFLPSVSGLESSLSFDCGLLPRLQAALALAENTGGNVLHCRPEEYEALAVKNPLRFYLVDPDAPGGSLPQEPEEPEEPEQPEEPEEPQEPEEPEQPQEPVGVTGVSLNRSTADLDVGQSLQLTASVMPENADNKAVVFTSSKPSVATVSSTGLVKAEASGSALISAVTQDGGFEAGCNVNVESVALPGLWQGSKTANGMTVSIQGKRVTIDGVKNSLDSNQGGGYLTDNMPVLFGTPTLWQTFPAGTKLKLTVSNVTGSHNCHGVNAACVLRKTDNTILMGGTWAQTAGVFEYTCTAATPVYGLLFYIQNGESCEGYGFDVEFTPE